MCVNLNQAQHDPRFLFLFLTGPVSTEHEHVVYGFHLTGRSGAKAAHWVTSFGTEAAWPKPSGTKETWRTAARLFAARCLVTRRRCDGEGERM